MGAPDYKTFPGVEGILRTNIMKNKEEIAKGMYDTYCKSVGGVAFNGDKLPESLQFFADEANQKQADAWRAAAEFALNQFYMGNIAPPKLSAPDSDPRADGNVQPEQTF